MVNSSGQKFDKDAIEITRQPTQNKWRRPELKKLPIAATAGSGKGRGNEGGGGGKGDAGAIS